MPVLYIGRTVLKG